VLGRAVALTAAHDTMVEVRQQGRTAVRQSATNVVADVLPGVTLEVHRADPGRAFDIGVRRRNGAAVDLAARLVDRSRAVIETATAAGATGTADSVRIALGLGPAAGLPGAGAAGAPGSVPGEPAEDDGTRPGGPRTLPGLHLDRRDQPALDRRELAAAFDADVEGTTGRLTATARALSGVAANTDGATWEAYAAARAAQGPDPLGTYTPDARKTGRDEAATADLTRREKALLSVLTKLQDQGDWLGRQVASSPS